MKSGFYRVAHFLFAWLVRLLMNIRSVGRKNEPKLSEGPYIIVSNHISAKDPITLCAVMRRQQPHWMAKKELFFFPLGPMIRGFGAYPVDRGGADVGAVRKAINYLQTGHTVGMFPQGHRNPGVDPRTTVVRSGVGLIAVKSGAQILPCYIKTKKKKYTFFCKKTVIVGKPIKPEELAYDPEKPGEYDRISKYIFEKICQLGDGQ